MRIEELEWDEWNVQHIAEHGVEPWEVEEVCEPGNQLKRS